jgi:hypothetical protein
MLGGALHDDPNYDDLSDRASSLAMHPILREFRADTRARLMNLENRIAALEAGARATGRFETRCAVLAGKIYAGEVRTATDAFAELKEVYPSDEQFRQAFQQKEEENDTRAAYLLTRLEDERQRVEGGKMGRELKPNGLTVEHILPKSPGKAWAEELRGDPSLTEDCTYRIGNMCLLTAINRKLGNQAFAEKKVLFAQSRLQITNEVAEYDVWNREAIEERQRRMSKGAVAVWRFQ